MNKRSQTSTTSVILVVIAMILCGVAIVILVLRPETLQEDITRKVPLKQESEKTKYWSYDEEIRCSAPYINFGVGCCLDNNYNRICDNDEKETRTNIRTHERDYCEFPYIKIRESCCIDDNNNRICDSDEIRSYSKKAYSVSARIGSPFEISDIDAYRDEIRFNLEYEEGPDIIVKKIEIDDCKDEKPDRKILSGEEKRFTLDCDLERTRFESEIIIEYIEVNGNMTLLSQGEIEGDFRGRISGYRYYDRHDYYDYDHYQKMYDMHRFYGSVKYDSYYDYY